MTTDQIVVICGGVGAARFLRGLVRVVDPAQVTAVINVADDMVFHGLKISPDIDTITYTLADAIDPERGWGLRDETWRAMEALGRYGSGNWFSLGDQDLATHMHRTTRLAQGATLTEVTAEIAEAWNVGVTLLPVTNAAISTQVTLAETGEEVGFQEYFVGAQHGVPVSSVRFDGIENASMSLEVEHAVEAAAAVILAPSNPIVSIAPVLDVPGVRSALRARRNNAVGISPLIDGAALKGPAAHMMTELGLESSALGVAALWSDLIATLVIDDADAHRSLPIAAQGVTPFVTDTIMANPTRSAALARATLAAVGLRGFR